MPIKCKELYTTWSDSRQDTRIQVGNKVEEMYNKPKLTGYILENKENDAMVPLFSRWSDSRQDTRTQTENHWETYYNGTEILLGYIFSKPQAGLVPLYKRWSPTRNDSRTQVGNMWESFYSGGGNETPIGYIIPALQNGVVRSIEFPGWQNTKSESIIFSEAHSQIANLTITNKDSSNKLMEYTFFYEDITQATFLITNPDIEIGLQAIADIIIVDSKGGVIDMEGQEIYIGRTTKRSAFKKYQGATTVPAMSSISITLLVYDGAMTIPFKALIEYGNSKETWEEHGYYTVINTAKFEETISTPSSFIKDGQITLNKPIQVQLRDNLMRCGQGISYSGEQNRLKTDLGDLSSQSTNPALAYIEHTNTALTELRQGFLKNSTTEYSKSLTDISVNQIIINFT